MKSSVLYHNFIFAKQVTGMDPANHLLHDTSLQSVQL